MNRIRLNCEVMIGILTICQSAAYVHEICAFSRWTEYVSKPFSINEGLQQKTTNIFFRFQFKTIEFCHTDLHNLSGRLTHFVHEVYRYAHNRGRGHQPAQVYAPIRINVRDSSHHFFIVQYCKHENQLKITYL